MSEDFPPFLLHPEAQDLLFREAHTAYDFLPEPIHSDAIAHIYEMVKWGPSSGNTQPLRYIVLATKPAKARLVPHLAEANREKAASAPLNIVLAADTCFHEHMNELLPYMPNAIEYFRADAIRREEGARFNATLQSAYFILGIRAAGLAAGPMLGFDKGGVDGEFFPDGRLRSILVINVGKPGANASRDRQPRLSADQVIRIL